MENVFQLSPIQSFVILALNAWIFVIFPIIVIKKLNYMVRAHNLPIIMGNKKKSGVDPKYLFTESDYVVADNNILLRTAAAEGRLNLVKYFIKHGGNPTAVDNYAIKMASKNGHYKTVEYLLTLPHMVSAMNIQIYSFRL